MRNDIKRKMIKITAVCLALILIYFIACPKMSKVMGINDLTAADVVELRFVQNREQQYAWTTADPKLIADFLAYFERLRCVPKLGGYAGFYMAFVLVLAEPLPDGSASIHITNFSGRSYTYGHQARTYFALGPTYSQAKWESILSQCERID